MSEIDDHPSSDELVLLFFGDLDAGAHARIAAHVAGCAACRAERDEIASVIALADAAGVPDPGHGFEAAVWARLEPQIRAERRWSARHVVTVAAWAAAIGAIVVGAYSVSRQMPEEPRAPAAQVAHQGGVDARERVLLTAVDAHLAQTEMLFVELLNAPSDEPGVFEYARSAADDLVSSGRLYRETARQTGDTSVAGVLDELEAVLVELARGPETPRDQDLAALRQRIDNDGLLFKVRAVTYDVKDRQDRLDAGEGAL